MEPRLSHVAIMVDLLEPAIEFYVGAFGLKLVAVAELPEIGVRNAFMASGDETFIELVEFGGEGELTSGSVIVALEVDDLDASAARLEAHGVKVVIQRATENIPYRRGWITKAAGRGTVFELCPSGEVAKFVRSRTLDPDLT